MISLLKAIGKRIMELVNLTNKKILVAGASSGIGQSTAILLSKLGAGLILVARNEERLKATCGQLQGSGHVYYSHDLSDVNGIESFVKRVINDNGAVDGMVYSAGVADTRPFRMMKPENLQKTFDVNFFGFVELVRCLTTKKAYNPGMSVVGISSISSVQGNSGKVSYCASKGAMDAAVRAMAKELAPKGIRINTINPALVHTKLFDEQLDNSESVSEEMQMIIKRQYMGIGEPEDIANMAAYLLSDAARYISGANMLLDGGRYSS